MLSEILPFTVYEILFVFARCGAAIMTMPGLGEAYVQRSAKLMLAVVVSIVILPTVAQHIPPMPADPIRLFLLIGGEIGIGLFLGIVAKTLSLTMATAGTIIAFQAGMANAMFFNAATAQQSSVIGAFLLSLVMLLIFVTDLHHLLLIGIADSYIRFTPNQLPPIGDFANMFARVVADAFIMAMQIAAPFIFAGLVFYSGLGLMARLLPQMHVFFIALPLQILLSFLVLLLSLEAIMYWFMRYFEDGFKDVIGL